MKRDARLEVGEEIGVIGYAHGSVLLGRKQRIERFGPLAQRGIIAALSPFDVPEPDFLLLDLTTAGAASGSPVFRLDGDVVGIIQKGQEGRNALVSVAAALVQRDDGVAVRRTQIVPSD